MAQRRPLLSTCLSTPIRYRFADQGFAGRLVDWSEDRTPPTTRGATANVRLGTACSASVFAQVTPAGPRRVSLAGFAVMIGMGPAAGAGRVGRQFPGRSRREECRTSAAEPTREVEVCRLDRGTGG
jgi:hypothetical protein